MVVSAAVDLSQETTAVVVAVHILDAEGDDGGNKDAAAKHSVLMRHSCSP